ncbi:hypothetical protein RUND412_002556 [Rhizina undulata]
MSAFMRLLRANKEPIVTGVVTGTFSTAVIGFNLYFFPYAALDRHVERIIKPQGEKGKMLDGLDGRLRRMEAAAIVNNRMAFLTLQAVAGDPKPAQDFLKMVRMEKEKYRKPQSVGKDN